MKWKIQIQLYLFIDFIWSTIKIQFFLFID